MSVSKKIIGKFLPRSLYDLDGNHNMLTQTLCKSSKMSTSIEDGIKIIL